MISVSHVITGLEQGGAEIVLLRLLERSDASRFRMRVISLSGEGHLSPQVRGLGIPVDNLSLRGLSSVPVTVARGTQVLRREKPHVVQTWMYHGDLIGGLAARAAGVRSIAWGLHAGTLPPVDNRLARMGIQAAGHLSSVVPRRIVCCSHSARSIHAAAGYDESKMLVIENGFELENIPRQAREAFRSELGATHGTPLVARVARFHQQKDYPSFIRACGVIHRAHPDALFVMVGKDVDPYNASLMKDIRTEGIEHRVRLLGPRDDIPVIYAASDVAVSSSAYGEALPLALGEAMAVGVPVVTTDVGDSARIVGDPARVTPPGDPNSLGNVIIKILDLPEEGRRSLGALDRQRIGRSYSLEYMASRYLELYEQLAAGRRW